VLVTEDSPVMREYLVHLLSQDEDITVVATAANGREAVEQAERLRPDLILMDVHMPKMNGYDATREIMTRAPTPIVVVSASFDPTDVAKSFAALEAGALAVLEKPPGLDHPGQVESARQLVETVKLMAEVKVVRRWRRASEAGGPRLSTTPTPRRPIRLVGVAASTGGPQVLAEILGALPPELAAPIVIVQHIAAGFTAGLVTWLAGLTPLAVKLAEHGEGLRAGTVYLAPDGVQMSVHRDGSIALAHDPARDGFCPSASHLFDSVAEAFGSAAMGIVLSGMGRDGVAGLARIRTAGGLTVAQDADSSVIFGMPGEAFRSGAAEHVLNPEHIARLIRHSVLDRR
jgi:two-component system chemotaxis response regulator CheB